MCGGGGGGGGDWRSAVNNALFMDGVHHPDGSRRCRSKTEGHQGPRGELQRHPGTPAGESACQVGRRMVAVPWTARGARHLHGRGAAPVEGRPATAAFIAAKASCCSLIQAS